MKYDDLEAHPLAGLFRLMTEDEYETLKGTIGRDGLIERIRLFEGRILDGRNRYRALKELNIKLTADHFLAFEGSWIDAENFVFAANAARRQMKGKDLENLIMRAVERHPHESDRAIAKMCGTSHVTVARYRRPPTDPEYDRIAKTWDKLSASRRKRFVDDHWAEIRECRKDEPGPKAA